jgi:hypothetical protein
MHSDVGDERNYSTGATIAVTLKGVRIGRKASPKRFHALFLWKFVQV